MATMANPHLDSLWKEAFPDRPRPLAYSSTERGDDGFYPLTDVSDILANSLPSLTHSQLFAHAANNADVLRVIQQEWTKLEKQAQHIKTRDPLLNSTKDPQQLPSREVFEERKEAVLYDYKYDGVRRMLPARFTVSENVTDQEKFDCREPPEPFSQGGFVPNEKQYKSLMAAAKNEGREHNPDNQIPYTQNFAFRDRPKGTWIAKVMPPDAPPPPRTRAREAQLNGTAERQTRFNGEKVPLTRQLSTNTLDLSSPSKRTATPVEGASPALKKRRIETVDVTNSLPRKKHPNQYTKRREAEEAARLAAQQGAMADGQNFSSVHTDSMDSPSPMKKKHPNQHTKRREREEAERRAREEAELGMRYGSWPEHDERGRYSHPDGALDAFHRSQYSDSPNTGSPGPYYLGHPNPSGPHMHNDRPRYPNQYLTQREREQAAALEASYDARFANRAASQQSLHPNQYTKQHEQEESTRLGSFQYGPPTSQVDPPPPFAHPQSHAYHPNAQTQSHPWFYNDRYFPPNGPPPAMPQPIVTNTTITSSKHRHPSTMTKEELRTHLFKDHELTSFLEVDHSWLNDDLEKAAEWKARILASPYPVRTWAMLRKWKEWRAEGKDKRPRDKDGNRIKAGANPNAGAKGTSIATEVKLRAGSAAREAETKNATTTDTNVNVTNTINRSAPSSTPPATTNVTATGRPASPLRRPTRSLRTRLDTTHLGSPGPQQLPRSPLANGINARDLGAVIPSPNTTPTSTTAPAETITVALTAFSGNPAQTARSFNNTLRAMNDDELDATAKVDTWQYRNESQTDYSASTVAGKGVLRQRPSMLTRTRSGLRSQQSIRPYGTEDELYPADSEMDLDSSEKASQKVEAEVVGEVESEDPLHGTTSMRSSPAHHIYEGDDGDDDDNEDQSDSDADSVSSETLTDSNDKEDGTWGSRSQSHNRVRGRGGMHHRGSRRGRRGRPPVQPLRRTTTTRTQTRAANVGTNTSTVNLPNTSSPPMRRTRSTRSSNLNPYTEPSLPSTKFTTTPTKFSNPAVAAVLGAITRQRTQPQPQPYSQRQQSPSSSPAHASGSTPTVGRRTGLRPNPPKRTLTGESVASSELDQHLELDKDQERDMDKDRKKEDKAEEKQQQQQLLPPPPPPPPPQQQKQMDEQQDDDDDENDGGTIEVATPAVGAVGMGMGIGTGWGARRRGGRNG